MVFLLSLILSLDLSSLSVDINSLALWSADTYEIQDNLSHNSNSVGEDKMMKQKAFLLNQIHELHA